MNKKTLSIASHLFAFVLFLVALPSISFASKAVCIEGSSRPADVHVPNDHRYYRPTRSAKCPYGFDEVVARIAKLSADTHIVDSVETVETALGIPEMTTDSDDTKNSSYQMTLSGSDGWGLVVWVREEFPSAGPDRFVPGPRPKRLYSVRDAKLIVELNLYGRRRADGTQQCWPVNELIASLKVKGWKDMPLLPSSDGALPAHSFEFQDKSVGTLQQPGECTQNLLLSENPSKG